MSNQTPTLLALDFDGVICNGLKEYFQTTWQAYPQIWHSEIQQPQSEFAERFYQLRPVIESGWEMPVLLRALVLGGTCEKILGDWATVRDEIVAADQLEGKAIANIVDGERDRAIKTNLENWLSLHSFYPGIITRIKKILASSTDLYIVTTKEGRFVQQLLQQEQLDFPTEKIIGKESQRPKSETLRQLIIAAENPVNIWFVEDRLESLYKVQKANLDQVKLFLADWGYNTPQARKSADKDSNIKLLALEKFSQDFPQWLNTN